MKMKINLDKKTVMRLLEEHVEKLVLGVFLLLAVWIIYGVANRERIDDTPKDLGDRVARARQGLEKKKPVTLEVRDYDQLAARSRVPITEGPYDHDALFKPLLFEDLQPRGAPELFAVEQLRGMGEMGSFPSRAETPRHPRRDPRHRPTADEDYDMFEGSVENVCGRRWVVLTGLVPIKKQDAAFKKAFKYAVDYDPEGDVPFYFGYRIQRLEVLPTANVKDLDWEKATEFVSVRVLKELDSLWAIGQLGQLDVVPDVYQDPALTFPLAPLVGRGWSQHSAHEPEIPYLTTNEYGRSFEEDPATLEDEKIADNGEKEDTGKEKAIDWERPRSPLGEDMGSRRGSAHRSPISAHYPGLSHRRSAYAHGDDEEFHGVDGTLTGRVEFKLLRFFDFDVKPGKRYVYRVRLVLANPNYRRKSVYLKGPELGKKKTIEALWSEPSEAIFVPQDTRLLVKSVKAPRNAARDPTADVVLIRWMQETGKEVFAEVPVLRGQVLNLEKQEVRKVPTDSGLQPIHPAEALEQTDLFANTLVLDINGGQKLPGGDCAPGELLVMDVDGCLSIRSELDDFAKVDKFAAVPKSPDEWGEYDEEGMMPPEDEYSSPHGRRSKAGPNPRGERGPHGRAASPEGRSRKARPHEGSRQAPHFSDDSVDEFLKPSKGSRRRPPPRR